jgi:hypothetical protein
VADGLIAAEHRKRVVAGMTGLLRRNPALRTLAEFWLEGMEHRGINDLVVSPLGVDFGDINPQPAEIVVETQAWNQHLAAVGVNLVIAWVGLVDG